MEVDDAPPARDLCEGVPFLGRAAVPPIKRSAYARKWFTAQRFSENATGIGGCSAIARGQNQNHGCPDRSTANYQRSGVLSGLARKSEIDSHWRRRHSGS